MSDLEELLQGHVEAGTIPGAVGLVTHGDEVEMAIIGLARIEDATPMDRDTIFRVASITKPLMATVTMMLVEDGRLGLDSEIREWLPELATPSVVRTPAGPVDDVVPAERAITVRDLLTSTAGWGFASEFSYPALAPIFEELKSGGPPGEVPAPAEWVAILAGIPLLHQPGAAYLYNTSFDLLGVLLARVVDQPLPDLLAERVFGPLGMVDTDFFVPGTKRERFASFYGTPDGGGFTLLDPPDGGFGAPPAFPSGAGGLVSTLDDWLAFCRLLAGGGEVSGRRLLDRASVTAMTTNQLTPSQAAPGEVFLDGQGWGFGGGVDTTLRDPWNVIGRYGWVGGTGTSAYVGPATGQISILLTQRSMESPVPPACLVDFWTYAATA